MQQSVMLTIASLLSILFMTLHLADDIVRGFENGGPSNLLAVPILVIWLYGTLVLAERRSEAKQSAEFAGSRGMEGSEAEKDVTRRF